MPKIAELPNCYYKPIIIEPLSLGGGTQNVRPPVSFLPYPLSSRYSEMQDIDGVIPKAGEMVDLRTGRLWHGGRRIKRCFISDNTPIIDEMLGKTGLCDYMGVPRLTLAGYQAPFTGGSGGYRKGAFMTGIVEYMLYSSVYKYTKILLVSAVNSLRGRTVSMQTSVTLV